VAGVSGTEADVSAIEIIYLCSVCRNAYTFEQLSAETASTRLFVPCRCKRARTIVYVLESSLDGVKSQAMAGARLQLWAERAGYWLPETMQVFKRGG